MSNAGRFVFACTVIVGLAVSTWNVSTRYVAAQAQYAYEVVPVYRVVDGDTLDVLRNDQRVRLRLIGMDTPETVDPRKPVQCFGPEASARAHELLDNQWVALQFDPTQGESDKYKRLLVYVWLPDGRNYAETMIRDGFAREYTYSRKYQLAPSFIAAQSDAKTNGRGLWNSCVGSER